MEYINLKDPLFTLDPDKLFSDRMKVPRGFWNDMYRRHTFWDYSTGDLVEWLEFKTNKKVSRKTIYRMIIRQEVYNDAQRVITQGVERVSINFFTRNKDYVLRYNICRNN